jgi:hypothetical protein
MPFATVVAMVVAGGCVNANSTSYYYGYSQPTLLAASSSTDSLGSQNVSFVQTAAPVSNLYQIAQPYQAAPPSGTAGGMTTANTPAATPQSGAPASTAYTSSYFQSTYAATPTSSSASSAAASQQTQALSYGSYIQTPASSSSSGSGPSAITVAYMSAYTVAVNTPVPGVGAPSSPLGTSYFQVASALSPLNTASSSSQSQTKLTQVMTPYGPRFMVDIYNPEPGTVVLLVGGLGVLFAFRKRLIAR